MGQPQKAMKHTDFYKILTVYLLIMGSVPEGRPEEVNLAEAISMEECMSKSTAAAFMACARLHAD